MHRGSSPLRPLLALINGASCVSVYFATTVSLRPVLTGGGPKACRVPHPCASFAQGWDSTIAPRSCYKIRVVLKTQLTLYDRCAESAYLWYIIYTFTIQIWREAEIS